MNINTPQWHDQLYDEWFIRSSIDGPFYKRHAKLEAKFVIKKLALQPGMTLLDVPCGSARHSVHFLRAGLTVTGVDINPLCIQFAKKNCKGLGGTFVKGDMKDLKRFYGQFDALTNLFTSFGYFETDKENEAVLKEMVRTLKPGGKIALHLLNRDWLLKVFKPIRTWERNGHFEIEARDYNPKTKIVTANFIRINLKTGKAKRYYHRLRLYSKSEMVKLMKRAGLKNVKVYPAASEKPFTGHLNSHPLYIGTR